MVLGTRKKKALERNLSAIKTQVAKNISKSPLMRNREFGGQAVRDMTQEAMPYIVKAADEYDKKKDNIGFVPCVAHRAVLRYQDQKRKEKRHYLNSVTGINMESLKNVAVSGSKYFDEIENKMEAEDIKECFDEYFPEEDESNKIYRSVFNEYVYPKMIGEQYKTLKQISEDYGMCIPSIVDKMRDEKMKSFINKYIEI